MEGYSPTAEQTCYHYRTLLQVTSSPQWPYHRSSDPGKGENREESEAGSEEVPSKHLSPPSSWQMSGPSTTRWIFYMLDATCKGP
jgi:hypothetical protein